VLHALGLLVDRLLALVGGTRGLAVLAVVVLIAIALACAEPRAAVGLGRLALDRQLGQLDGVVAFPLLAFGFLLLRRLRHHCPLAPLGEDARVRRMTELPRPDQQRLVLLWILFALALRGVLAVEVARFSGHPRRFE
jgi:hypothetical protein